MSRRPLACVVLAAGKGTRMKSTLPKVLHAVAGRSMIGHVLSAISGLGPDHVVVVVGPGMEQVTKAVAPFPTVIQLEQRGTADAVRATREALSGFEGDVLVVYGDTPLISTETLRHMIDARRHASNPAVVVLGMRLAEPGAYGRVIVNPRGEVVKIVEYLDADESERQVELCNAGLMAFDGARLFELLGRVRDDNAKKEFYLTDVVALARSDGASVRVVETTPAEVLGVNSRAELADIERLLQQRLRRAAMDGGATLLYPETVYFSIDTCLGRDVVVGPHVMFGPGVAVGDNVEIRAFCHLERAKVESGAVIGPFARLRPGAEIGNDAHIGNFVEIKASCVEAGAKVNHLTYIGDAIIGARANIGAGTITCNYDGFQKHRTEIGVEAFIGSNASLVAPVKIGAGAIVAAGSVITSDIPVDALAVARGRQETHQGWAPRFRQRAKAKKKS
ncbi:UDP-N-acetylglucosamine pyrophosphorylase / Glucosamine-1-phosphate N-acetyltransferase [Azospirillaceae bacterium]